MKQLALFLTGLFVLDLATHAEEKKSDDSPFRTGTIKVLAENKKEVTIPYQMLQPLSIEKGTKYPLVIFLHGAGERGDDNKLQLKYFPQQMSQEKWSKEYPCFLLAPQCPKNRRWVEVNWGDKKSVKMADQPSPQMQAVFEILQSLKKELPIDEQRIYLTGLSMGGYGSWEMASRWPELFAAVAPICGGGDERQAKQLVNLPLWAFHGDADTAVPVERSRQMIEAIKKVGGNPKYTEYPKAGHNVWSRAYAEENGVVHWMFSQKKMRKQKPSEK